MTLLMRASMMSIAERIASATRASALVTGESLGQVASQTVQGLRFTGSIPSLPVLRPLIGMDKEQIISLARRINTYETSILPYDDCCTIFAPKHPLIKPDQDEMRVSYAGLDLSELEDQAAENAALTRKFGQVAEDTVA